MRHSAFPPGPESTPEGRPRVATATKTKLQNFIDGEFVDAAGGATDPVTNPATGEQIAEMPLY
jgi:hypothetical protein